MELKSLLYNGISWKCRVLGEQALLLEINESGQSLGQIHQLAEQIEAGKIPGVVDVVPAYQSVAIFFDRQIRNHAELIEKFKKMGEYESLKANQGIHEIPVCYELGLDWKEVEKYTGLNKPDIVEKHTSITYSVAMMGFIPGFVFLDGMDQSLECPRRSSPRTNISPGSVGIGGSQTGIYSLESPGGWNIIGRTPISFFDIKQNPPTQLKAGDEMRFVAISEPEFRDF